MILVTGGNGFIGRRVCSLLCAHGREVVALDWKGSDESTDIPHCRALEIDIRDKQAVDALFREQTFAAVVHHASMLKGASTRDPATATQINIVGTLNILEAARQFQVPKIVYGSSISVYGSRSAEIQTGVDEMAGTLPQEVYGAGKRYIEIVGDAYRDQFGVQSIALRISCVVGPGAVNTSTPWRSEIFEKLGSTSEVEVAIPYRADDVLPLVHVEDVAAMIECLVEAERPASPVYNTPSETWTLSELAAYASSLNSNVRFTFGASASGIPRVIDGHRFVTEFGLAPQTIRERLKRAAADAHGEEPAETL